MSLYVEWKQKWMGAFFGWEYREGRTVMLVQPDMDNGRWYWSVFWPKQQMPPRKNDDGSQWIGGELKPQKRKWGHAPTEAEAKQAALAAFGRGRESTT